MNRQAWLLASTLCWAGLALAAQSPGALREYVTPRFTIVTDDKREAQRLVERLPNFERVLARLLRREPVSDGKPTRFYLVRGTVWSRYLSPGPAIIGEYVPLRFSNYILMDHGARSTTLKSGLMHEYTHYFLRTNFSGFYPLWFDEGLAQFMEVTQMRATDARIEPPRYLDEAPWIPMSRLLTLDKTSREYLREPGSSAVHQQSWALVHRGLLTEAEFGARIFDFLGAINDLVPLEDAVRSSFGMTVAQLDESMRLYLARPGFAAGKIEYERVAPLALDAGRALGEAQSHEAIATVMLDTGFNLTRVREVVDAAERAGLEAARAGVLRARLAVRDRDDAALDAVLASLPVEPDARTARGMGLALFERVREAVSGAKMPAEKRMQVEARAFALLDHALSADAGDVEPAWAYALLAASRRENLDVASERLTLAKARMRNHADLALASALVHEAREDPAAALDALADAARFTSSLEERAAFVQRAQELRQRMRAAAPQ